MNSLFQNAIVKKPQKTPPIWMMRQAGRYHHHYQNLRKKYSFMELCKQPEIAAEVALGPVQDFDFDVAILFSDLLFPLEGLGMGLEYTDHGPRLGFHLDNDSLKKLKPWREALETLQFQKQAMIETRKKIPTEKSIIGFVGGPWTLYVYAVEGSHLGSLTKAKKNPELLRSFMKLMVPLLKENIALQIAGGAEVVMILDTAAGDLAPGQFQTWAAPYLLELAKAFPGKLAYYSKGTQQSHFTPEFLKAWSGRGIDHRWNMAHELKRQQSENIPGLLQGNLDQSLLHLPKSEFQTVLKEWLGPIVQLPIEQRSGWVCGLGHGILPQTPEENVHLFIQTVREMFR